ncbi:unnamed protein product, partial [Iphiclides podalirius]
MCKNERAEVLGMSLLGVCCRFPVGTCAGAGDVTPVEGAQTASQAPCEGRDGLRATIPFIAHSRSQVGSQWNTGESAYGRWPLQTCEWRKGIHQICSKRPRHQWPWQKADPNAITQNAGRVECRMVAPAAELRCRFYRLLSTVKQSSSS